MKFEDIKAGETYNVRVKVIGIAKNGVDAIYVDDEGIAGLHIGKRRVGILSPISPENGIKNTESASKYDPCREFKVGDKVRVRKIHGNLPQCRYNGMVKIKEGDCCTINEKEHRNLYWITTPSGDNWCFDIAYFELVTPVEEIEPYCVRKYRSLYAVEKIDNHYIRPASYDIEDHPHAKEAAEAECDRLNEEFRKKRLDVLKRQNEEPESYGLSSHTDGKCVDWHVTEKDGFICASFHARPHGAYTPSADREAAQAERDCLNAEHRKEEK